MKNTASIRQLPVVREKKRGFTLTELAIVLGIIGLVIAAIWIAASTVNEKNNINSAVQELQTVTQNILTLNQNRPFSYATQTDDTSNLIKSGAIPGWMATGVTAGQPWSSGGFVVWANPTGNNTRLFRISFYNIPLDACAAILIQGTSCDISQPGCPLAAYTAGSIGGGGSTAIAGLPVASTGWQTLTPAAALNACNLNAAFPAGAGNSVEFDFSL